MSFVGEAKIWGAKIMSACMGMFIRSAMKKELDKDLADIKQFVEQHS